MLLSLNNDCLRLIIEKQKISCFFVCERLKVITIEIWKPKKKVNINMNDFKDMPLENFIKYISCISDNLEHVYLREVNLVDIKNIKFPKVHFLEYINFQYHSTDSEKLINSIFPKLTSLTLGGDFTGSHLQDLTNLETLDLNCCQMLQSIEFENINQKLTKLKKLNFVFYDYKDCEDILRKLIRCETLEEIFIDHMQFLKIYDELFTLKNLKKIVCWATNFVKDVFQQIIDNIEDDLRIMIFVRDSFRYRNEIELRKLTFYNCHISRQQLWTIATSLSGTLEEFYYIACHSDFKISDGIFEIVRHCKKLKILHLTGATISVKFIERVAAIIEADEDVRNQILVIYGKLTKTKLNDLKALQLPKKLQISFEFNGFKTHQLHYSYIHSEWNTINGDK